MSALRRTVIAITLLQAIFSLSALGSTPLFLEREMRLALDSRDDFYQKAKVARFLFPLSIQDSSRLDSISTMVNALPQDFSADGSLPWRNLLSGLSALKSSPQSMNTFFERAIAASLPNAGATWALGMEFGRLGLEEWETTCLDNLEKMLYSQGANGSTAVTQLLLTNAVSAEKQGQSSRAQRYYGLSRKFDPSQAWPMIRNIVRAFPLGVSEIVEEIGNAAVVLAQSWETQVPGALAAFLWLRTMLSFLVIGILLITGIKYAPIFLHGLIELFPASIAMKWKRYYSCALFFSCSALGAIPFLWTVVLLAWRHCIRRDKWILGGCCCLLLLYPASVRFEDMLRGCLLPDGSVSLFRKALHEGNYPDLDRAVRDGAAKRPDDFLVHTAAALVALKGNDIESAKLFIRQARMLRGDDPVVLLTEGIVFFVAGDIGHARDIFESCHTLFPKMVQAVFNCGQCYLVSNETIKGMEYLDRAAKINSESVNSFIALNDKLFSRKWPKLRQFMMPDYSSGYFWSAVFPHFGGSWASSSQLWGRSFLGIPLAWSCVLFPLLFIAVLMADFFIWGNARVAKIFQCKLCRAPMCRQCKKGVICERCFEQLHQIRNENIRQRIIEKILLKKKKSERLRASLLDVLFPGGGMLLRASGVPAAAILVMAIAASGYGAISVLSSIPLTYPYLLMRDIVAFAWVAAPMLNLGFAVRAAIHIIKERRS